jgi:hypothetical protein
MANPGERITHVHCTEEALVVSLADGRSISAPLAWYPRLLHATAAERDAWQLAGAGYGIHWPTHHIWCSNPSIRKPLGGASP